METTESDFVLFKEECRKWIERYSLQDWEFYFEHEDGIEGSNASYECSLDGMSVLITFNTEILMDGAESKLEMIKSMAFHEITEILLVPLRELARGRNFDMVKLERETHSIIHRLYRLWKS